MVVVTEKTAAAITGVPIINIEALILQDSNQKDRIQAIREIGKACTEWGFFYAVGHGINKDLIQRLKQEGINFFRQPKEAKLRIKRNQENVCGYFEGEFTKNKWDWKEGWDIESRDGTLENQGTGPRDRGMNQYPEDLLEFNAVIKEFHAEAFKVAFELLKAIWTSLGGDLAYIYEEFGPTAHTSRLRLNYYPKCPTPSQCFGVGEHADPGAVTLLLQDDDVSSLQVKRDGVWYNVHPVKDSLVINTGDMVGVWSNGIYKAPIHRALSNKDAERYSFPFFIQPRYDAIVQPMTSCITKERPARYRPFTFGYFHLARYDGDLADLGEEIQITHLEIKENLPAA